MTAYALKPNFADLNAYRGWLRMWRTTYNRLSADIRRQKVEAKDAQRSDPELARRKQRELHFNRRVAFKMMTLLQDGRVRRDRLRDMLREIAEQPFPLRLEAKVVDFSFNRVHNEFQFMPRWLLKVKGRTYYVEHVDCQVPFSTREMEHASTKGMLRFRNVALTIDKSGMATLGPLLSRTENPYTVLTSVSSSSHYPS